MRRELTIPIYGSVIVGISISLVLGVVKFMNKQKAQQISAADVNYSMPRPQKSPMVSRFDLEGRDIDREYLKDAEMEAERNRLLNTKPKKVLTKSVANATKDPKKAEASYKAPAPVNPDSLEKDKSRQAKIDGQERLEKENQLDQNENRDTEVKGVLPKTENVKKIDDAQPVAQLRNNQEQILASALRKSLLEEPSIVKMDEFYQMTREGRVKPAVYSETSLILAMDSRPNAQIVGIYGLERNPSFQSFQILVGLSLGSVQTVDNRPVEFPKSIHPQYQNYVQRVLLGYNRAPYLNILGQALQNSSIQIVTKAAELINAGLQRVRSGQPLEFERSSRGVGGNQNVQFANYQELVPILNSLRNSGDQNLLAQINGIFAQLESRL